jgi:hypothetical protein
MDTVNQLRARSRSDDEGHDQIGSQSATPSGVRTPQPDLHQDKRLPGIVHAYFGQVGSSSTIKPDHSNGGTRDQGEGPSNTDSQVPSDTTPPRSSASASPPQKEEGIQEHEKLLADKMVGLGLHSERANGLPTPPKSSASSFTQKDAASGTTSTGTAPENRTADRPTMGRQKSAADMIPQSTRRHTAGMKSLSNIVTQSNVHAAHISNPTSTHSSTSPSTPTGEKSEKSEEESTSRSALSSLTASFRELVKLTRGAANPSRKKSTPPDTPRALSKSNGTPEVPPETTKSAPSTRSSNTTQQSAPSEVASSGNGDGPAVGPPKGKLFVKISEARGLRPSRDPYVVAVFEWNEYISGGSKGEQAKTDAQPIKNLRADIAGGVAIQRSTSEMARSMAIPMKSRQSSTTSLSDQKNSKSGNEVTEPKWDHEAIL